MTAEEKRDMSHAGPQKATTSLGSKMSPALQGYTLMPGECREVHTLEPPLSRPKREKRRSKRTRAGTPMTTKIRLSW